MRRFIAFGIVAVAILLTPVVASALTATTTISSQIASVISLSTSGTVNVNVTPAGAGLQTIANDTVTVSTNDTAGYTLKLGETGVGTTLASGGNNIPAVSGSFAFPSAETPESWGYRVDGDGGFGAGPTTGATNATISGSIKFAAVAASGSPDTIKTTSTTATNDTLSVWYGVAVDTAQPAGTYTNSVTYTATAN